MPPLIRLATPDDAEQVHAVYAPYCHTPISFEAVPPGPDEMRRRMVQVLENHPWLVCEKDGEIVGYAYAGRHGERAGLPMVGRYFGLHRSTTPATRPWPRLVYVSAGDAFFARLRQRLRRSHAAERGECRAARGDGVPAGRRLPAGGFQVRRVARRGLVSTTPPTDALAPGIAPAAKGREADGGVGFGPGRRATRVTALTGRRRRSFRRPRCGMLFTSPVRRLLWLRNPACRYATLPYSTG